MKFRPLHDRVLVRRVESDEKTPGGIIIPDTAQEKPMEGEVIQVGPGARDETGKLVTSVLNEDILNDISDAGNGIYVRFDNRPANFRSIINAIDMMEKRTLKSHIYSEYEDRFQSFALLSMGMMIIGILLPTSKKEKNSKKEELF